VKRIVIAFSCCAITLIATLAAPAVAPAASKWTLRQLSPGLERPLSEVSCPSESLCVAVGGVGTLAFSQVPTGGAANWHVVDPAGPGTTCLNVAPRCPPPGGRLRAVSCTLESLCVVVGYEGSIFASTDPTGGTAAWSSTIVNEGGGHGATHLTDVSCPSPSLCAAVSGGYNSSGKVLTSTNPAAGQWQVTELGDSLDLRGVSCGTPSLCVAVAREGRIFVSTNPTGGASAWTEAGTPGGPGDLEGVACVSTLLCAAGNLTGNVLTSTAPATGGGSWRETNAGGSVQITGVSCPTASRCLAVDNNGDVLTSTDPTGGAGSWHFENLIPFEPTEEREGQPPRNALSAASCASTSLCVLVGIKGRIFTATDPFSVSTNPPGRRNARPRPHTILVFAEHFGKVSRGRHIRARFRFYSPAKDKGFECKRDRDPYRRCRSPLRYRVALGRHVLRVRAIGPTGLRGPAAIKRFRVLAPIGHPHQRATVWHERLHCQNRPFACEDDARKLDLWQR
jgi:hypothetical protein